MRFENSICRYDEDDLIRRVFAILELPAPPPGGARQCAEAIVKAGALIAEMIGAANAHISHVREQQARFTSLLELLDSPRIEPTPTQVKDDKLLGRSLCIVSRKVRAGVEIHAGIGAICRRGESDILTSEVAPITGPGMDRRRDYLLGVVEMTRDAMEQTYS